jgi:hypothetical protein
LVAVVQFLVTRYEDVILPNLILGV